MEIFVLYELEDIFFGWKAQTASRSSRNHLETSTQSAYKRKTMNSNQNVWLKKIKSCNESRSEKGERSCEERNLKVIVVIVHVTVSDCVTFRPRLHKRWIASAIHSVNDFSERERERALLGPIVPFSILQSRRFFWCKLSRVALEGEWARPIPEPLGTIRNEPVASLSFQDHVTKKRRALGTGMGET